MVIIISECSYIDQTGMYRHTSAIHTSLGYVTILLDGLSTYAWILHKILLKLCTHRYM